MKNASKTITRASKKNMEKKPKVIRAGVSSNEKIGKEIKLANIIQSNILFGVLVTRQNI